MSLRSAVKRARSVSEESSASSSFDRETSPGPTIKSRRIDLVPQPTDSTLSCQLPPTCTETPHSFASPRELQNHYERCHLYICRAEGCEKAFPDARLLDLHVVENHDPLAAERQKHGEKIFECFLSRDVCSKKCSTPRGRRNHMIQMHHFSKQYFFSVTNHGIGDMVKRFGPGASMIRQPWKAPPEVCRQKNAVTTNLDLNVEDVGEPSPEQHHAMIAKEAVDMDKLTSTLATTSLELVPPSVTRKQKKRDPATHRNPTSISPDGPNQRVIPNA